MKREEDGEDSHSGALEDNIVEGEKAACYNVIKVGPANFLYSLHWIKVKKKYRFILQEYCWNNWREGTVGNHFWYAFLSVGYLVYVGSQHKEFKVEVLKHQI